jgi:hypothetical protein
MNTARNSVIDGNGASDLDDVRKRAYELYEEDGRRDGKHEDHWYRAETEVRGRSGKNKPARQEDQSNQRIA